MQRTSDPRMDHPWTPDPEGGALAFLQREALRSYQGFREGPVGPSRRPAATAGAVDGVDLEAPIGLVAATEEAAELMRAGDLASASARCFGYFNPTAAWPGVIADALAAMRNPQVCLSSHAPASVAMERRVLRWMQEQLGFPEDAHGTFTSGGSEANATGLLVALVGAEPAFAERGVTAFRGAPRLYVSSDCHLAWIKIARAAGLGSEAVRLVPTSGDGRLDPDALERFIQQDRAAGSSPLFVAATAGTTNGGELDPLDACRAVADRHGLHLHVDAAWAGALVVDPKRRGLLAGIEAADSVTIDAHKWLSVPMGAGMVFVRDRAALGAAFAVTTGYMPSGDGADAYITSFQWSRRFLGLRLWMMLRSTGPAGYGELFDHHFALADRLREQLPKRGWVVRNSSPLPVVLFEDAEGEVAAREIADAMEADGVAYLGCVEYEGRTLLRFCPTSFLSTVADVELLLDRLGELRSGLSEPYSSS